MVLALRAIDVLLMFVGVALVASCRHGDWMEFAIYHEYKHLLGASMVACLDFSSKGIFFSAHRSVREGGKDRSTLATRSGGARMQWGTGRRGRGEAGVWEGGHCPGKKEKEESQPGPP
jgi:hypothetical protein